ncbi:hypothetical protein K438DRAFT_1535142, partial [Mycena galopus ATCC 62051]
LGLPIMTRNNDATELCITKGQEGIVVGWNEAVGTHNQRVLDTLFVELVDPPKTIQVPGLPTNVVGLARSTKNIWCALPDDMVVNIVCEQVLVLPNFAMTDYASQGKTRAFNIVDLNNCRTRFSYYTALSRSSTSAGTVILQGMDPSKITRGISGFLRQEFRELETLNEYTRLRYEGTAMPNVRGVSRRELLSAFLKWRGKPFDSPDMHPSLLFRGAEVFNRDSAMATGHWRLVGTDIPKPKKSAAVANKSSPVCDTSSKESKRELADPDSMSHNKRKVAVNSPQGIYWDHQDYSCAYDALFTCLFNIWVDHGPKWTARFDVIGPYASLLAKSFTDVSRKIRKLEQARDVVRAALSLKYPAYFPSGPRLTSLDRLTETMFGGSYWGTDTTKCTHCGSVERVVRGSPIMRNVIVYNALRSRFGAKYSLSHWLSDQKIYRSGSVCADCGRGTLTFVSTDNAYPFAVFSLADTGIQLDPVLYLPVGSMQVKYVLRGLIYSGGSHFTARVITSTGGIWYHDGIET